MKQGHGGRGRYVIAARRFESGEAVAAYAGEAITVEERERREQECNGDHIMQIGARTVDGIHSWSGGQYLNTAMPWITEQRNNVKQEGAPYGTLRTSRGVSEGDELLLDYGGEYWSSQERVKLLETLYEEWLGSTAAGVK